MKQYKDFTVEDFLLDDDFLDWVRAGCPPTGIVWVELLAEHPEKKDEIDEAKTFLKHQRKGINLPTLSDEDLTKQVGRVLARTDFEEVPVRQLINYSAWWRVAAAVTLLIGLSWSIFIWQARKAPFAYEKLVQASTSPLTEVVNGNQTTQSITLPDGSHIEMAKNARISYSTQMDKAPFREVYLSGEAFFEVTKDPYHPFFVYANGLITRVVGTSFIIQTIGKQVSVIVRSGRVAVYPMKEDEPFGESKKKITLTPNQQATFIADENQLTQAIASQPVSLSSDSQTTTLQFDNTPIADVFAQLEQIYGIPIQYDGAKMKNCFLTSTLVNESFYSKLTIICKTIGASYNVQGTQISITSNGCD